MQHSRTCYAFPLRPTTFSVEDCFWWSYWYLYCMKIAQLDVLALQLVRRGSHGSRYFCQIVRVKMLNNLLSVRPCFDGTARHPGELRAILCRYVAVSCQTTISHVLPWAFGVVSYQPAQCPRQAGIDLGHVGKHVEMTLISLSLSPCVQGQLYIFYPVLLDFCHTSLDSVHVRLV